MVRMINAGQPRFLSALLSQVLVAFTLEVDNEFKVGMARLGCPGVSLSLNLWDNLFRFVPADGVSVRELAVAAMAPESRIKFQLGCLERWRLITFDSGTALAGRRDGWGSGRGIRQSWIIRLTHTGQAACSVWLPLPEFVEQRWESRFGSDPIARLRQTLLEIAGKREHEWPRSLQYTSLDQMKYPPRSSSEGSHAAGIPTLLTWILLAFSTEFDRESKVPLALCANTIRVLGTHPIREADVARLTGGSPEAVAIGWQLKPFVVVEPDPSAKRGKVLTLSPKGQEAKEKYLRLNEQIERDWESRFGNQKIDDLRESLAALFVPGSDGRPLIAKGLIPAQGTVRSGAPMPSLGRRELGSAALQRARDRVAQTKSFFSDPAGTLPHYPLWDMNRGFGP